MVSISSILVLFSAQSRAAPIVLTHSLPCNAFGRGKVANLSWPERTLAYARRVAVPLWINGLLGTALFATYEHLFTRFGLKDRYAMLFISLSCKTKCGGNWFYECHFIQLIFCYYRINWSMMLRNVLWSAGAGAVGGCVHAVLSNASDVAKETLARPKEERSASVALATYRSLIPKGKSPALSL